MKKIFLLHLMISLVGVLFSQRNINDLFFVQNSNYYNPGYAPSNRDSSAFVSIYDTHTFLKIAPNNVTKKVIPTLTYQAFSRIRRFTFLYNFNYQPYSYTSNSEIGLGIIYTLPFRHHHKLSFGLRGDFSFYNLKHFNAIDYVHLQKERPITLLADIDFGIHYFIKKLEIGISGKHLLASKYQPTGEAILFQNQRGLYTKLSYNFSLGKHFTLKPTIFGTPLHYMYSFLAIEIGAYKQFYFQYAIRAGKLQNQFSIEYHPGFAGNRLLFGLAFTQSLIYSDYNIGIRLGYYLGD